MNFSDRQAARQLRVITVCLDIGSLASVKHELKLPDTVEFIGNFTQYVGSRSDDAYIGQLRDLLPDIVIVDFDENWQRAENTAEILDEAFQHKAAIFAACSKAEPNLIINAMRSGCTEFLAKPLSQEALVQAFGRVGTKKKERERNLPKGKVITLIGAKGGAGVTALAVHLGTFVARTVSRKALLVDHHPDLGLGALYLGIDKVPYNFYELIENVQRLDAKLVQGFVVHHPSGLDLLASPGTFGTATEPAAQDVEYTLDFLKTMYDYTFVDCAPGLSPANVAAIRESDQVWLVATPDVACVRNLARYLDHLARFSYSDDTIKIIINRHVRRGTIAKEHFEKVLKKPVFMTIPNSYQDVMEALNAGTPISPEGRSDMVAVFRDLVALLPPTAPQMAYDEPRAFAMVR